MYPAWHGLLLLCMSCDTCMVGAYKGWDPQDLRLPRLPRFRPRTGLAGSLKTPCLLELARLRKGSCFAAMPTS